MPAVCARLPHDQLERLRPRFRLCSRHPRCRGQLLRNERGLHAGEQPAFGMPTLV